MELVKFKDNADYVRFSKSLTVKVNEFITVEADCFGGLMTIDSELFGKVIDLEDPETETTYYVGGKQTKYQGFKELYGKLFQDNFEDFQSSVYNFVENQVLSTYKNNINSLTTKQKIKLLREQIDLAPKFESSCGKTIVYRQWSINRVLYSLKIKYIPSIQYVEINSDKTRYGVPLLQLERLYLELKNK